MEIHYINNKIHQTALQSSSNFLGTYLDYEEEIINALKEFSGIKTELYIKSIDRKLEELVRFSTLFSDLTILNNTPSGTKGHLTIPQPESIHYNTERKFTIPPDQF